MGLETWSELSDPVKLLIQMGVVASAITAIIVFNSWLYPKLKFVYRKIEWAMSDENDHTIIMERLDGIAAKLERNGGAHIPDALDRIENHVKFLGARQQAALHMRPNPIFETDVDGKVTFINAAYKRIFGIDGDNAEGMGWVNIIEPSIRDEIVTKWFRAVRDKRNFDEDIALVNADGSIANTHVIAHVIRGDNGSILGHHGEVALL